jgi:hypothetical protein
MTKWCKQQELILKRWSEEAQSYSYMHDRSYKHYAKLHMHFSLPVIILSTISGTANFATNSFPVAYRGYVSLATGSINLIAGIITTIAQFMKIPEMLESHRASSTDFAKFSRNIRVELSLPVQERTMSGREFINQCRLEMEQLYEKAPDINLKLVKAFGYKFKNKEFHMPAIIDLQSVDIFEDEEEQLRLATTQQQLLEAEQKKIEDAAKKIVEEKKENDINLTDVNHGISDMLSSFRMAVNNDEASRAITKGAGKKEEDLDSVADEIV